MRLNSPGGTGKFDEFELTPDRRSNLLIERGNRLAKHVSKTPRDLRAIILFYNPRKGLFPLSGGQEAAEYTKGILVNGYKIDAARIVLINGGFRDHSSLEYWIARAGEAPPVPMPHYSADETVICPEIRVAADGFRRDRGIPIKFSAAINGADPKQSLRFDWYTQSGEIVSGQGTNTIRVKLSNATGKLASAGLRVIGLAPECDQYAVGGTQVGNYAYLLASIQYNLSYLKALLDHLINVLNEDPALQGHIIFYGPRNGPTFESTRRVDEIRKYYGFRGLDPSRITVMYGGRRETFSVELFVVPTGVAAPMATPSISDAFYKPLNRPRKRKR